MNRRSVLRWLGLAPVAAPAAVAAASSVKPAAEPVLNAVSYKPRPFSFDGPTLRIPSLRSGVAAIISEQTARSAPDDRLVFLPISSSPHLG